MSNNNLNNILSQPYVQWLETALQELAAFPNIKGICFNAVTESGDIYTNYYNIPMQDKLKIAGIIQQDAMLDTLTANKLINTADDEDETNSDEES